MLARLLVSASSLIMLLLGGIHLLYTLMDDKLVPRDPAVREAMNATTLALTSQTTVWRAWIGFNGSHSLCALFFGLLFGFLALAHSELLFGSAFLQLLGVAVLIGFVVLARLYWFSVPFAGVSLALACFVAGLLVAQFSSRA